MSLIFLPSVKVLNIIFRCFVIYFVFILSSPQYISTQVTSLCAPPLPCQPHLALLCHHPTPRGIVPQSQGLRGRRAGRRRRSPRRRQSSGRRIRSPRGYRPCCWQHKKGRSISKQSSYELFVGLLIQYNCTCIVIHVHTQHSALRTV